MVGVVHVGEATLLRRVKEFALTASSNLTAEDFERQIVQLEEQHKKQSQQLALSSTDTAEDSLAQVGCLHVGENKSMNLPVSASVIACKTDYTGLQPPHVTGMDTPLLMQDM